MAEEAEPLLLYSLVEAATSMLSGATQMLRRDEGQCTLGGRNTRAVAIRASALSSYLQSYVAPYGGGQQQLQLLLRESAGVLGAAGAALGVLRSYQAEAPIPGLLCLRVGGFTSRLAEVGAERLAELEVWSQPRSEGRLLIGRRLVVERWQPSSSHGSEVVDNASQRDMVLVKVAMRSAAGYHLWASARQSTEPLWAMLGTAYAAPVENELVTPGAWLLGYCFGGAVWSAVAVRMVSPAGHGCWRAGLQSLQLARSALGIEWRNASMRGRSEEHNV